MIDQVTLVFDIDLRAEEDSILLTITHCCMKRLSHYTASLRSF